MIQPNAEVRRTNQLDFWTVSRTNSDGFLDREPIASERAAASCHIALIGDSFAAAEEVPIADKSHIRLEALAAQCCPSWTLPPRRLGSATPVSSTNCRCTTNLPAAKVPSPRMPISGMTPVETLLATSGRPKPCSNTSSETQRSVPNGRAALLFQI